MNVRLLTPVRGFFTLQHRTAPRIIYRMASSAPTLRTRSPLPPDLGIPETKRPRLEDTSRLTPAPTMDDPPLMETEGDFGPEGAATAMLAAADPVQPPRPATKKSKRKKKKYPPPPEPGSSEDVILKDVFELLGEESVTDLTKSGRDYTSPLAKGQIVELMVAELSSNGESLSLWRGPIEGQDVAMSLLASASDYSPEAGGLPSSEGNGDKPADSWVVVVPFALPGEKIRARIYANNRLHSMADLIEVVQSNDEMRDMSRVKCKYFGVCGGCQYQMLSYETQLDLKRRVVDRAYANYACVPSERVPRALPTIPSPKAYGYRTKITPHFDVPPRGRNLTDRPFELTIGFGEKGRRRVMDIEECAIATPVLNEALPAERERIQRNIGSFKRGATLLLRDSLDISVDRNEVLAHPVGSAGERHTCVTAYKEKVRERVGDTLFEFPAGSFFQNNNSVLLPLVHYVRDAIFGPLDTEELLPESEVGPTHLVDTYCGAGFFAISLAPYFKTVTGVEISAESIDSARHNAQINSLPPTSPHPHIRTKTISFSAGKSESIFASVVDFPPDKTVVIIDPPRKGCDQAFLDQLVKFRPRKLVYVSCNVHTQARDIGRLLTMMDQETRSEEGRLTYQLESLRGFDLFPQTAHVESVAVLKLV